MGENDVSENSLMRSQSTGVESKSFADPSLPLAVLATGSPLDEPPRMRQHICRQLQRQYNVLFVTVGDHLPRSLGEVKGERLIHAVVPHRGKVSDRSYSYNPLLHRILNVRAAREVQKCVSRFPSQRRILVNFIWDFPELLDCKCWDYRVYVCVDEFPGMWRRRHVRNRLVFGYRKWLGQAYENAVARKADLCLTPHHALRQKLARSCGNMRVLYHANDFNPPIPVPRVRGGKVSRAGIRVAFMGYLHYRLLDVWLKRVAEAHGMELHLIGPIHDNYDLQRFGPSDTWVHHGVVVGEALQRLMNSMDVLIMPYDPGIPEVRILTSASKLFQYIGTLKPVVVSDLPDLLEFPAGVIYRAKDPAHFIEQIRQAAAEDCETFRKARLATAIKNSWDRRGEELLRFLEDN